MTLEEKLNYLEEEIKNIKEEINKTHNTHNWIPEQGEKYFFVSDFGSLGVAKNLDVKTLNALNARCRINNIFKYDENKTKNLLNYTKNVFAVQNRLLQLHEEFCPEHKLYHNYYATGGKDCRVYRRKNYEGIVQWSVEYLSLDDNSSYNEVYFPNVDVAKKVCDILNAEHFMLEK